MPDDTPSQTTFWTGFRLLDFEPTSWLIQDIIPERSLVCFYGKRGQGKTFLALDWACCVASGTPWAGKAARPEFGRNESRRGRVAYVLAERPEGLKRRILGWLKHRGFSEDQGREWFDPNDDDRHFYVAQKRFALDNALECGRFIERLKEIPDLALVVLDPLVHFMDGSENDTRPMQQFIDGALRIVRDCKCTLLLIHHEGKGNFNNQKGARGSSALEAGMDTVIYLDKPKGSDVSVVTITKQREARAHFPLHFEFEPQKDMNGQELGIFPTKIAAPPPSTTKTGDKATAQGDAAPTAKKRELAERNAKLVEAVRSLNGSGAPPTIATIMAAIGRTKKGFSQGTARKALKELAKAGQLVEHEPPGPREPLTYSIPAASLTSNKTPPEGQQP